MREETGHRRLDPSRGDEPAASDAWQVPQPRLEEARSSAAGMDPERLAKITARMQAFVEEGTIAGAVMLLARHGEVALVEAVGYEDLESKKPMRPDTIFNIGSMTKTFTAVGIMILMEEGLLTLSDPVEKHLPEFRDQLMVDSREGDKPPTLKVPPRPITIYDLLTHTSGMPWGGWSVFGTGPCISGQDAGRSRRCPPREGARVRAWHKTPVLGPGLHCSWTYHRGRVRRSL